MITSKHIFQVLESKINEESSYVRAITNHRHDPHTLKDIFSDDFLSEFNQLKQSIPTKFKLIPLGQYIGNMKSNACVRNSIDYAKSYPEFDVYYGHVIYIYGEWEKFRHFFNVKNGKVMEVTDSMEAWVPGDPIYYYGLPCPKEMWSKAYADPNNAIMKISR
jgi:hypothetical protein